VFTFFGSQPAYYYYQHLTGIRADRDLYPTEPDEECGRLDVTGRVWVVFGFDYLARTSVLDDLRSIGKLLESKEYPGAGAYLFDFRDPATEDVCLKLQEPLIFAPANLRTRPFGTGATS
jgi:hypothetical protein